MVVDQSGAAGDVDAPLSSEVEISVFGPGYGEAIAIHLGGGSWFLVDSCLRQDRRPAALEYLKSIRVDVSTNVVGILATHWHDDHVRGLAAQVKECSQAKFYCSAALSEPEFLALTKLPARNSKFSSGVQELASAIEAIADGRTHGSASHLSSARRIYYNESTVVSEIWALSPSDADVSASKAELARLLVNAGTTFSRIQVKQNDSSVVLLLKTAAGDILLGADLEDKGQSRLRGWNAIADDKVRPSFIADLVKVPHHGSITAHNDEVNASLQSAGAIRVVTPWQLGGRELPTDADKRRLRKLPGPVYLTASSRLNTRSTSRVIDKTVVEFTRNFRPVDLTCGHVQARHGGSGWVVVPSGGALQL